jgi:hypothetical protein
VHSTTQRTGQDFKANTVSAMRLTISMPAVIRVPGWPRRITIFCVAVVMAVTCSLLATSERVSDLNLAGEIFGVSVLGFSLIALLSFDCVSGWCVVDFAWVVAAFVAVAAALINISEGARQERLFQANTLFGRAFADLLYATQIIVANECEDSPTRADLSTRSPPPYDGACDRMKHFLPQMEYQYNRFVTSQDITSLNAWGRDVRIPDTAPKDSWVTLYDSGARFTRAIDAYSYVISENTTNSGIVRSILLGTNRRYWYFFMAFFVGLRMSKATADLFRARAVAN